MDQIKIGRFIASQRKAQGMTQAVLAEKLAVSDRAVSKWETGKSMPDSSIMLDLCSELKISVNELLIGEKIDMKEYDEKTQKLLLEMAKAKEERDKRLLKMEVIMGIVSLIPLLASIIIVNVVSLENGVRNLILIAGVIPLLISTPFAIEIEQKAGYYECQKCHHKYVPTYKQVLFSQHINRTRYMKCPKCNQKSWQKKVLSAETEDK